MSDWTGSSNPNNLAIGESDNGGVFHVSIGTIITVKVGDNPLTGRSWKLKENEGRTILFIGAVYQQSPSPGVGTGGLRVFSFRAVARGSAKIDLAWGLGESEDFVLSFTIVTE